MRAQLAVFLVAFLTSGAAWADKGLVAHWDFNEGKGDVLHDRSGNNNHGAIHGAKWVKCGKGYALKFDGKDDYVDCGNGPSLDITGPITLQAWVQPTGPNIGEPGIVGKFFESYALTYYGHACFYIASGGNRVDGPLTMDSWTHAAGTFDGENMRMYANGLEVVAEKSKFKQIRRGKKFFIGCIFGDPTSQDPNLHNTAFFPGLIHDVRVYRRALSAEEILATYRQGVEEMDLGDLTLEAFFYPEADKAVLSVDFRWLLPFQKGAVVVAELARAGSPKALQTRTLSATAPRGEDEAEFSLKGLKAGTYELRAFIRKVDKVIQAEDFARSSKGVKAHTSGWLAGSVDLLGGWAEYDFRTRAEEYRLSILAARIFDSAGIRCTIDGKQPVEVSLNGPHGGTDAAWKNAKWETIGVYRLRKGPHTLRVKTIPVPGKKKGTTCARYTYIDAFGLDSVGSGAQAQKVERVTFRYPFAPPAAVPSPKERVVPTLPALVTPPPYKLRVTKGGGFTVSVKGRTYRIESSYSYPHGGYNRLVTGPPDTKGERSWKVSSRKLDAGTYRVTASGEYYSITRLLELQPSRVVVRDTIRNTSDDVVGIILSNHVNTRGAKDIEVKMMNKFTAFVHGKDNGVGTIALDDLYQIQEQHRFADGLAELRTDDFGLDKGASYTVEWAVYPTATPDYYDFINQVRKDEGINGRVDGTLVSVGAGHKASMPTREIIDLYNARYLSVGTPWYPVDAPKDAPRVSIEGIEFMEYRKECAHIRKLFEDVKRAYPDVKVMLHVAHGLYCCNKPKELFPDSRIIGATGRQAHWGPNALSYYGRYWSKEMFDDNWRWWLFYPTPENSFGKALINAMEYMVDELGATAMWGDGFVSGYAYSGGNSGGYSYDRWDGHSVDIDHKTKLVTRKKTCVPWVSLPVLKKVVRIIGAKGGVMLTNEGPHYPPPRSLWKENMIASCEGSPGAVIALHLGRTVSPLGSHGATKNERDCYRDLLAKLDLGALYFAFCHEVSHKSIVEHMYPITFESIHAGIVRGKERIVTKKPGVYGWPGDRALHIVYLYDARGALRRSNFLTTVDDSSVRTEVELSKDQSAVIVRLPVTLTASNPVNLSVRQYDINAIRLVLNGKGKAQLRVGNGDFPVKPGAAYLVKADTVRYVTADKHRTLSFSANAKGPLEIRIAGE